MAARHPPAASPTFFRRGSGGPWVPWRHAAYDVEREFHDSPPLEAGGRKNFL